MPYLFAAGVTVAIFTLAACSSMLKQPPGITYAESVKQLGIYPVYPPREDLQVGDIYGIEYAARTKPKETRKVFVDSVDLTPQIQKYLNRRYTFANTTGGGTRAALLGTSASLPTQSDAVSTSASSYNLFEGPDPQNLSITAFPGIEVDSGLTLNVAAGSSNLGAMFGFGGGTTLKMTLNYGRVTSYSVPIPVAKAALEAYCEGIWPASHPEYCDSDNLSEYINLKYQSGTDVTEALPLMVSKVYLARAISYTFNDRTLAAAAASLVNREQNAQASAPTIDASLLTSAVANKDAAMVTALAAFQNALNRSVVDGRNVEGATISIAGYTSNSVTFEEVFQRPVAIGFEGVYTNPQ